MSCAGDAAQGPRSQRLTPRELFPQAISAFEELLKIDDSHLGARFELMFLRLVDNYDWDAYMAEFERLQRLYPGDHGCWAICNRSLGRTNEARTEQALWEKEGLDNPWLRSQRTSFSQRRLGKGVDSTAL